MKKVGNMSLKKKKKLLLILLIFCCTFSVFGYVYFFKDLNIMGFMKVSNANWSVKFTDIETTDVHGKAINYKNPVLTQSTINFYAEFNEIGDSLTYKITITNDGTIPAKVAGIYFTEDTNEYVDYALTGIDENTILKGNESIEVYVVLNYSNTTSDQKEEEQKNVKFVINWEQYVKSDEKDK